MSDGPEQQQLWIYGGICLASAFVAAAVIPRVVLSKSKPNGSIGAPDGAGAADQQQTEDVPGGTLTVYFGSQTGTAEAYAQIVAAEGIEHGFATEVVDLEDFSAEAMLAKGKAVFIMATYGRGDATDNAHAFYEWIRNRSKVVPNNYLSSLEYSVFGLGNTQYEHFNLVGRTTDKNLEKLGAQRMHVYGEGDDDTELEEDFEGWKEALWQTLVHKFGGKIDIDGVHQAAATSISFSVKMITHDEATSRMPTAECEAAGSTRFHWHAVDALVVGNRELRADSTEGSTRCIEIDLEDTGATYHTGDNLAVLPLNDAATVERLCTQLGYDARSTFVLEYDNSNKAVFPTPCTVRDALMRFLDIMSTPRRTLIEQLVPYVVDTAERETMHRLSSKEGREEYHNVVEGPGRTTAELILENFKSIKLPLEHFLHIIPHLHPRYYTISSSSAVSPKRAHLTVAVFEQDKTEGRVYRGICSNYLSQLHSLPTNGTGCILGKEFPRNSCREGSHCRVLVRQSAFRLPANPSTPILMVGPGTGVAPMRAMLQERKWQKLQGRTVGSNWLYFGCRCRTQDYIYQDELEEYEADGTLDRLRLAFSREGTSKVYVQHRLRQDAALVWELLEKGAYVYVCGGTHMGTEVHDELVQITHKEGLMSLEHSRDFMRKLQHDGRYVEELWS